ncbi:MAG: hypothetical protein H0X40_09180 [Chthoniobacterales bacterium]|nr:hypothetical protein [Chthoniobacterales bacterium]
MPNRLREIRLRVEKGGRPFTRNPGDSLGGEADRDRYLFHEYFHGDSGAGLGRAIRPDELAWSRN